MYEALAGIQVLEVSLYAFVPSAGAVLADWGADVVKIEQLVATYDFSHCNILSTPEQDDQTQRGEIPLAEAAIELVVRKRREAKGDYMELQGE